MDRISTELDRQRRRDPEAKDRVIDALLAASRKGQLDAQLAIKLQEGPFFEDVGQEFGRPIFRHKFLDADFIVVAPGEFKMGPIPSGDAQEERIDIKVRKPFLLGQHVITQAQWKKVFGSNPSRFPGDTRPVEQVSWIDCQFFLEMLNRIEFLIFMELGQEHVVIKDPHELHDLMIPDEDVIDEDVVNQSEREFLPHVVRWVNGLPCYFIQDSTDDVWVRHGVANFVFRGDVEDVFKLYLKSGEVWRLPSEAEWEYACRAGTETRFPSAALTAPGQGGDSVEHLEKIAVFNRDPNEGHEPCYTVDDQGLRVSTRETNDWGFAHMLGNVWEWCQDHYHDLNDVNRPPDERSWDDDWDRIIPELRSRILTRLGVSADELDDHITREMVLAELEAMEEGAGKSLSPAMLKMAMAGARSMSSCQSSAITADTDSSRFDTERQHHSVLRASASVSQEDDCSDPTQCDGGAPESTGSLSAETSGILYRDTADASQEAGSDIGGFGSAEVWGNLYEVEERESFYPDEEGEDSLPFPPSPNTRCESRPGPSTQDQEESGQSTLREGQPATSMNSSDSALGQARAVGDLELRVDLPEVDLSLAPFPRDGHDEEEDHLGETRDSTSSMSPSQAGSSIHEEQPASNTPSDSQGADDLPFFASSEGADSPSTNAMVVHPPSDSISTSEISSHPSGPIARPAIGDDGGASGSDEDDDRPFVQDEAGRVLPQGSPATASAIAHRDPVQDGASASLGGGMRLSSEGVDSASESERDDFYPFGSREELAGEPPPLLEASSSPTIQETEASEEDQAASVDSEPLGRNLLVGMIDDASFAGGGSSDPILRTLSSLARTLTNSCSSEEEVVGENCMGAQEEAPTSSSDTEFVSLSGNGRIYNRAAFARSIQEWRDRVVEQSHEEGEQRPDPSRSTCDKSPEPQEGLPEQLGIDRGIVPSYGILGELLETNTTTTPTMSELGSAEGEFRPRSLSSWSDEARQDLQENFGPDAENMILSEMLAELSHEIYEATQNNPGWMAPSPSFIASARGCCWSNGHMTPDSDDVLCLGRYSLIHEIKVGVMSWLGFRIARG